MNNITYRSILIEIPFIYTITVLACECRNTVLIMRCLSCATSFYTSAHEEAEWKEWIEMFGEQSLLPYVLKMLFCVMMYQFREAVAPFKVFSSSWDTHTYTLNVGIVFVILKLLGGALENPEYTIHCNIIY